MFELDTIVSLCKRRGFIFQSSEIYGGMQGAYDYGPLGVELKNNLKRLWWQHNVYERDDMEGIDAAIIMHRLVWKYSGHEEQFIDPMIDCKVCKGRFRADKLEEAVCLKHPNKRPGECEGVFKFLKQDLHHALKLALLVGWEMIKVGAHQTLMLAEQNRTCPVGPAQNAPQSRYL